MIPNIMRVDNGYVNLNHVTSLQGGKNGKTIIHTKNGHYSTDKKTHEIEKLMNDDEFKYMKHIHSNTVINQEEMAAVKQTGKKTTIYMTDGTKYNLEGTSADQVIGRAQDCYDGYGTGYMLDGYGGIKIDFVA